MVRKSMLTAALLVCVSGVCLASTSEVPRPRVAVTQHAGTFNGVKITYTAWVEDNFVKDSRGKSGASVITVAYTRDGVKDLAHRPVIFAFNGGPPAASSALNFSGIGPVHHAAAQGTPEGWQATQNSADFVDNPYSPLDQADLVFIDPVGSGFSRASPGEKSAQWHEYMADERSVTEAIEEWLTRHHRESSPRYLIGESYGTVRAGLILKYSKKLAFDGVVLIGLDVPAGDRLMPYVGTLPTMAAGAWYFKKIDRNGRTVNQVFNEAETFARTDYITALMLGSRLPAAERARIATRMSQLIGLPVSLIEAKDLRIDKPTFMLNVLKDQKERTGLLDVRVTAPWLPNERGDIDDPALNALPKKLIGKAHLTPASMGILKSPQVGAYIKQELRFPTTEQYYGINFIALQTFYSTQSWQRSGRDFDTIAAIASVMKAQPDLRLMWVNGMYDLTCPAYLARFALDQDGIPSERLTALLLPGPHSAYEGQDNLANFSAALRRFISQPESAK